MAATRPVRAGTANLFPLAGFLASLSDLGIRATLDDYRRIALALRAEGPWTVSQLRSVLSSLLVRDREQAAAFRKRFDDCFALSREDQARFSGVDVDRALAELRGLAEEPRSGPIRWRLPEPWKAPAKQRPIRTRTHRRRWRWTALAALVLAAALGLQEGRPPEPEEDASTGPPPPVERQTTSQAVSRGATRVYPYAPVLVLKGILPPQGPPAWIDLRLLGVAALAYGWWFWRWFAASRGGPVPTTDADDSRPRLFRPGSVGGAPAPRLDRQTLDRLADSLGYFRSEEAGQDLDAPASVERTVRNGGIPTPVFELRKRVRSVLVLEDLHAEARAWNPIARELARGLDQRGVSVMYATFAGVPDRFRAADGLDRRIEDLEDDRRGYLVLIFSDGKGLGPPEATFALERLARWPQVAWMQLQERRAWDRTVARPALHGLPVFPADREGLLQALAIFTTERAPRDVLPDTESWRGFPALPVKGSLQAHVEEILGHVLLWAQSCAMVPPPLGLGLADRLRERFHPELPPDRVERLLALPGSRLITGGLRLDDRVLAVLREGFAQGRDEAGQKAVLDFLLEQIRLAEPADQESLQHQAWEWRLERIRLESDPEPAVERLAILSQGALGETIRADLAKVSAQPGPRRLPLRVRPRRHAARQLDAVAKGLEVSPKDLYRPAVWPEAGLATAAVALLALFLWRVAFPDPDRPSMRVDWNVPEAVRSAAVGLDGRQGEQWKRAVSVVRPEDRWRGLTFVSPGPFSEYRAVALVDGLTYSLPLTATSGTYVLELRTETRKLPCHEELPEVGLVIDRCPSPQPLNLKLKDSIWGVGERWPVRIAIEISEGGPLSSHLRDILLTSGDVDVMYAFDPGPAWSDWRAVDAIRNSWSSWTDQVEVLTFMPRELSGRFLWFSTPLPSPSLARWNPPDRKGSAWLSVAASTPTEESSLTPGKTPTPCPNPKLTRCGSFCVDLSAHPFHSGSCFQIDPILIWDLSEIPDAPPAWIDEEIQPRRYYRLIYAWNDSKSAVVVRSLPSLSGWDRGKAPDSVEFTLSAEEVAGAGNALAITELEIHCSSPLPVVSTQFSWRLFGEQFWRGPETSKHSGLGRILRPALTPWEKLCASR